MLKKLLESKVGQPITKSEFKEVMAMTDADIKFNFISFGKRPCLNDVIVVAARCFKVYQLC